MAPLGRVIEEDELLRRRRSDKDFAIKALQASGPLGAAASGGGSGASAKTGGVGAAARGPQAPRTLAPTRAAPTSNPTERRAFTPYATNASAAGYRAGSSVAVKLGRR
jgi:hypothetical protein